jgi:hypothetical protein
VGIVFYAIRLYALSGAGFGCQCLELHRVSAEPGVCVEGVGDVETVGCTGISHCELSSSFLGC